MERPIYRFLHLVFALGVLQVTVLIGLETKRYFDNLTQARALQERVANMQNQLARLREEVKAAEDPLFREAMARKMGYVRKDEVLRVSKPAGGPGQ
ncbi:MAG: hypothetical protein M1157_06245 [Deinococcus sp.]|nr:hypothetical protein [Deinococcus sp.]